MSPIILVHRTKSPVCADREVQGYTLPHTNLSGRKYYWCI